MIQYNSNNYYRETKECLREIGGMDAAQDGVTSVAISPDSSIVNCFFVFFFCLILIVYFLICFFSWPLHLQIKLFSCGILKLEKYFISQLLHRFLTILILILIFFRNQEHLMVIQMLFIQLHSHQMESNIILKKRYFVIQTN